MKNKRILIIDDNPAIHQDYKKILMASANTDLATAMFLDFEQPESVENEFEPVHVGTGKLVAKQ